MVKGKHKYIINRSQYNMAPSEPSSPTTGSPGYLNIPKEQDDDLKFHLIKMIKTVKEEISKYLKEIQKIQSIS